jgi:hypothetical protein
MAMWARAVGVVTWSAWCVTGCKATSDGSALKADILPPSGAETLDQGFLGEALSRLADAGGVYFDKAQDDPTNPGVIPLKVDQAAKTLSFDMSPFAGKLGGADIAATMTRLLTFPLPAGNAPVDLADPGFQEAFGTVVDNLYRTAVPEGGSIKLGDTGAYDGVFEQCKSANFSPTATVIGTDDAGGDYTMTFDCRTVQRQPTTQLSVTAIEGAALEAYAADFYKSTNELVRQRTWHFASISADPAAAQLGAIETIVSLALISYLGKLEPTPEDTYRSAGSPRPACVENPPAPLPQAATPAAAATNFCDYFGGNHYRECAFQSTTRLANFALSFGGILKPQGLTPESSTDVRTFTDMPLPTNGDVSVIERIKGHSGHYIAPYSGLSEEEEVLYRPGINYNIEPSSAVVALKPATASGAFTDYANFELVPCGTALTAEQTRRISHFRVTLVEP